MMSAYEVCNHLIIFTDSPTTAARAVNPAVHSGQGHSLAVCKDLKRWLAVRGDRKITFVQVPSAAEWGIHKEAHDFACSLPPVPGLRPETSLDKVRQDVTRSCQDAWVSRFQDECYCGCHFLMLKRSFLDGPDKADIQPKYSKGGSWLSSGAESNSFSARLCRCILNHAPIGSYYERFNVGGQVDCQCGADVQTRLHILERCNRHLHQDTPITSIGQLCLFLKENPLAFAFAPSSEGIG